MPIKAGNYVLRALLPKNVHYLLKWLFHLRLKDCLNPAERLLLTEACNSFSSFQPAAATSQLARTRHLRVDNSSFEETQDVLGGLFSYNELQKKKKKLQRYQYLLVAAFKY